MAAIRETCSSAARRRSIKRFQAGIPLHVRNWSGQRPLGSGVETYKLHEIRRELGRRWASLSQHRCVNVHNLSVKAGCVGRGGRWPPTIANMAARDDLSLNGAAPVNAFAQMNDGSLPVGYL